MNPGHPKVILIMGVSGSGKTTVARLLASRLGGVFVDADDFHPPANIEKMSRGIALDDGDRLPWLERLRDEVISPAPPDEVTILACSALKRSYREILGLNQPGISTVYLEGDHATLTDRLANRPSHYMKPDMLASQLAALEEPGESEALRFPITLTPGEIVSGILAAFFLEVSSLKFRVSAVLLDVKNLTTRFHTRNGVVHAVEDVSFSVDKGQTLGIVGESGSGKSVTCYSLLGLIPMPPGRIEKGTAIFDRIDLLKAPERQLQKIRGKRISMIFQDPMTSLNPFMRVRDQLTEPLELHEGIKGKAALTRAIDALAEVGIPDPEKRISSYPHEFSGGMRQRVMIAMALITKPELLICDEPTTALDVTVQKQVLDLIRDRQRDLGTAVIFITHDLAVVSGVCDTINVMYAGRIVESAKRADLFSDPLHAYTRSLLKSIPSAQPKGQPLMTIPGLPPNLTNPPEGCAFQPRNLLGDPSVCIKDHPPELAEIKPGHFAQNCPGCLAV